MIPTPNIKLTRRTLLHAMAGAMLAPALARAAQPKQPNFIFILVDDLRHDALGCTGNKIAMTPNMDALAARAVRFTNAFVTTSICSPSRAACMTGRYGSATGVMGLNEALNPGERTFAHELKAQGYRTALLGKWHLKNAPADCGFEIDFHFQSNGPYRNRQVVDQGVKKKIPEYIDGYIAQRAVEVIDGARRDGKPLAMFFCTQAPHMEWTPSPETMKRIDPAKIELPATWRDDLAGKPPYLATSRFRTRAQVDYQYGTEAGLRRHIRQYTATVAELDEALAPLLRRLAREDMRRDTWVILIGDNGWQMGEHGLTSKVLPYETSIRVPLLIAGPDTRARSEDRFALNADLAPTILELAGLAAPANMHGRSLAPLLAGRVEPGWRESFYYEALRPELESWPLVAVRTRRHKYVQTFDLKEPGEMVFEELYDLERDPGEMKNLAALPENAKLKNELKAELNRLRETIH